MSNTGAAAAQAASWRIRRRNRSGQFLANCTPWRAGLVVTGGEVCNANGMAWTAQAPGGTTAGTVAPNSEGGASFTDAGGVQWLHTWLLLTQPPPIT